MCIEIGLESTRNPRIGEIFQRIDRYIAESFEKLFAKLHAEGRIAPALDIPTTAKAFMVVADGMFWRRAVDVSLFAITIVTGILVDDAIVEIENIVRHMRMGKSPYRAALEAADEIGLAVIAITFTFTIIAVFVPVSFMGGIAGQYFKQFGLVVAFAVFFSLLVARLVTPLLAAYFMRTSSHEDKEGPVLRAYTRLVRWSVAHQYKSVALGLLIFAGSIGSFYLRPSGFLPAEDSGRLLLAVELPPGSLMTETRAVTDAIAAQVRERPEVRSVFINGGRVMGSGAEVRKATLVINLAPKESRKLTQDEVRLAIGGRLANLPGCSPASSGRPKSRPRRCRSCRPHPIPILGLMAAE